MGKASRSLMLKLAVVLALAGFLPGTRTWRGLP